MLNTILHLDWSVLAPVHLFILNMFHRGAPNKAQHHTSSQLRSVQGLEIRWSVAVHVICGRKQVGMDGRATWDNQHFGLGAFATFEDYTGLLYILPTAFSLIVDLQIRVFTGGGMGCFQLVSSIKVSLLIKAFCLRGRFLVFVYRVSQKTTTLNLLDFGPFWVFWTRSKVGQKGP